MYLNVGDFAVCSRDGNGPGLMRAGPGRAGPGPGFRGPFRPAGLNGPGRARAEGPRPV